jgi:hypothetical protein
MDTTVIEEVKKLLGEVRLTKPTARKLQVLYQTHVDKGWPYMCMCNAQERLAIVIAWKEVIQKSNSNDNGTGV